MPLERLPPLSYPMLAAVPLPFPEDAGRVDFGLICKRLLMKRTRFNTSRRASYSRIEDFSRFLATRLRDPPPVNRDKKPC